MIGNETYKIAQDLFNSLLQICQKNFRRIHERKTFFDSVDILYYKFHKISLNRDGLDIVRPDWLGNKKVAINFKK